MTENPEASVLTARRAPQHVRLFSADDAYEHLCILTLLPSLAPLHLMLADTPWPHGFGATLTNVGPLSEGFERSVASPLQPRRLRAMGRTVRSISSLSDNHSNSFQVAVRFARHTPSRNFPGLIGIGRWQGSLLEFRGPVRQQRDGRGFGVVSGLYNELFGVGTDVVADADEVGEIELE